MDTSTTAQNNVERTCADMLRDTVRNFGHDLERIAAGELFCDENGKEPMSAFEFFDKHALSIENWKIDREGECVGGKVLLCCGGPTVWATERGVFGAWGHDRAEYQTSAAGEIVEEFLRETMPAFWKEAL